LASSPSSANGDEDCRDDVGVLSLADEVVIRVPEELDHIETACTFRRPM
jgi:hypothetical protein